MATEPVCDHLVKSLAWSRKCLLDVMKDYPDDKVLYRGCDADNHLLWVVGHLAASDEWVLGMLRVEGSTVPESYSKSLFGYGSTPTENAEDYPSLGEVRGHLDHSRERLLAALGGMTDAQLAEPLGEAGQGCVEDAAEAFSMTAWHEGWHAGQLSTVRRSLGLPAAFG